MVKEGKYLSRRASAVREGFFRIISISSSVQECILLLANPKRCFPPAIPAFVRPGSSFINSAVERNAFSLRISSSSEVQGLVFFNDNPILFAILVILALEYSFSVNRSCLSFLVTGTSYKAVIYSKVGRILCRIASDSCTPATIFLLKNSSAMFLLLSRNLTGVAVSPKSLCL